MEITINYKDVELDVNYSYQPEEKRTFDHQGCDGHIDGINNITFRGISLYRLLEDQEPEIIKAIYKKLEEESEI